MHFPKMRENVFLIKDDRSHKKEYSKAQNIGAKLRPSESVIEINVNRPNSTTKRKKTWLNHILHSRNTLKEFQKG